MSRGVDLLNVADVQAHFESRGHRVGHSPGGLTLFADIDLPDLKVAAVEMTWLAEVGMVHFIAGVPLEVEPTDSLRRGLDEINGELPAGGFRIEGGLTFQAQAWLDHREGLSSRVVERVVELCVRAVEVYTPRIATLAGSS